MGPDSEIQWNRGYPSGDEDVSGVVRDLLLEILEYQPRKRLPPYAVLADIVRRGYVAGGMGGALDWAASSLQLNCFLYEDLERLVPTSQLVSECDSTTREEWIAWCAERDSGVDYGAHLALLNSLRDAELEKQKNPGGAAELAYLDAVSDYTNFLNMKLLRLCVKQPTHDPMPKKAPQIRGFLL